MNEAALVSALYERYARRVFAYAHRRCDTSTAEDVVSETFIVAWRRRAEIPENELPWLLVVARNIIANQHRSALTRRRQLDQLETLARSAHSAGPSAEATALERDTMLRALSSLSPREREALLLLAWDGLTPAEAACVADCTEQTFNVRVHRARKHLSAALAAGDRPAAEEIS